MVINYSFQFSMTKFPLCRYAFVMRFPWLNSRCVVMRSLCAFPDFPLLNSRCVVMRSLCAFLDSTPAVSLCVRYALSLTELPLCRYAFVMRFPRVKSRCVAMRSLCAFPYSRPAVSLCVRYAHSNHNSRRFTSMLTAFFIILL